MSETTYSWYEFADDPLFDEEDVLAMVDLGEAVRNEQAEISSFFDELFKD